MDTKRIALVHKGNQVGVVETVRQPYVGARFDDVAPGLVYRISGWVDYPSTAKVEIVRDEISLVPGNGTKRIV